MRIQTSGLLIMIALFQIIICNKIHGQSDTINIYNTNNEQTSNCNFKFTVDSSLLDHEYCLGLVVVDGIKKRKNVEHIFKNWHFSRGYLMKVNKESFENYANGICDSKKYLLKMIHVSYKEGENFKEIILHFYFEEK